MRRLLIYCLSVFLLSSCKKEKEVGQAYSNLKQIRKGEGIVEGGEAIFYWSEPSQESEMFLYGQYDGDYPDRIDQAVFKRLNSDTLYHLRLYYGKPMSLSFSVGGFQESIKMDFVYPHGYDDEYIGSLVFVDRDAVQDSVIGVISHEVNEDSLDFVTEFGLAWDFRYMTDVLNTLHVFIKSMSTVDVANLRVLKESSTLDVGLTQAFVDGGEILNRAMGNRTADEMAQNWFYEVIEEPWFTESWYMNYIEVGASDVPPIPSPEAPPEIADIRYGLEVIVDTVGNQFFPKIRGGVIPYWGRLRIGSQEITNGYDGEFPIAAGETYFYDGIGVGYFDAWEGQFVIVTCHDSITNRSDSGVFTLF